MQRIPVPVDGSPASSSTSSFDRLLGKLHRDGGGGGRGSSNTSVLSPSPSRTIDLQVTVKKTTTTTKTTMTPRRVNPFIDYADKTHSSDDTSISGVTFSSTPEQHVASRWGTRESLSPRCPTREDAAPRPTNQSHGDLPNHNHLSYRRRTDLPLPAIRSSDEPLPATTSVKTMEESKRDSSGNASPRRHQVNNSKSNINSSSHYRDGMFSPRGDKKDNI